MSNSITINDIKPKTLEGIKRLAKIIKRAQLIKHHQALEAAAIQAGFASYAEAVKALGD